jgi:glutaminyl-tRNA synthetase
VGGKGKKESNLLMNTKKKSINMLKKKEASNSDLILNNIVANIQSVDNFTLINQTVVKKHYDNNALLFANLILKYSDKVQSKDIEKMYYYTLCH